METGCLEGALETLGASFPLSDTRTLLQKKGQGAAWGLGLETKEPLFLPGFEDPTFEQNFCLSLEGG